MIYIALGIGFTSAAFFLYVWLQRKATARKSGIGICIEVFSSIQSDAQELMHSFKDLANQHQASILAESDVKESALGQGCFESSIQLVGLTKEAMDALKSHELPEKAFAVLSMIVDGEVQTEERNSTEELEFQFKIWKHLGQPDNAVQCLEEWLKLDPENTLALEEKSKLIS